MSLAIQLRPVRFVDVIGQGHVVDVLERELKEDKLPHALLFEGPPGTGKTTLAHIVAREVQGPLPDGVAPEIRELNVADKTGVDDMRQLVDDAAYQPWSGRYKVFILDEAQKLTDAAQNCLLRPLESSGGAVFIFCTTDSGKLIKPLKDRCQSFVLRPLLDSEIMATIVRAFKHLGISGKTGAKTWAEGFYLEATKRNIRSAREIYNAVEKFAAGMSLADSLQSASEHEPLYLDIAKAVVNGELSDLCRLLSEIKSADAEGLRNVTTAFLGNALVRCNGNARRMGAISKAIKPFGLYQANERGVAYQVTRALLIDACREISAAKEER